MSEILSFIKLLGRLILCFYQAKRAAQVQSRNEWLSDLESAVDALTIAKTKEEKLKASQSLVKSIYRLQ